MKIGVLSAAVIAMAGGAALWVQAGLRNGQLTLAGRGVFRAVGRTVLDGSLPIDGQAQQRALDGFLDRVDALIRALPPHAQDELSQLLATLASAPGRYLVAGVSTDWADASTADLAQGLQGMRISGLALKQQAYAALHDITAAAYFSDAATWPVLGYPGPLQI